MKKIFITVISICLCVVGTSGLAQADSIFLKLDGIPGEAIFAPHRNEIEVMAWSWQMSASNVDVGAGAGSTIVRPLIIHKYIDMSSPKLALALLNGESIEDGILTVWTAGSPGNIYARIKMWDIHVVNLTAEMEEGDFGRIVESVALAFSKVCYEYTPYDEQGAPQAIIEKCWDIGGNVEF